MKSLNNFFVKNIKKILFKENRSREFLIENLLNNNCDILISLWDNLKKSLEISNKYEINNVNNFKIEITPLDENLKIISIYLPYALNEHDYLIISFINNHPERMFFSGIELVKEKIVDNYKKSYILINCFSYWKDEKTHFRNIIISNEFKMFDIYYDIYLENLQNNDSIYIPVKEDYDLISMFFINVSKKSIEKYIYKNEKALSYPDMQFLEKSYASIDVILMDLFNTALQLSIKSGVCCVVPQNILRAVDYMKEHKSWLKQNEKMFYYSQNNFIDFYYNCSSFLQDFLYNLIHLLLLDFPAEYEFINIEKKTCCLS